MDNQSFDLMSCCNLRSAHYRGLLVSPVLLTLASTSAVQSQDKTAAIKKSSFDYKKSSFELKEDSVKEQDGIEIRDVNYISSDTDHAMNTEAVIKDRSDWLARNLRLTK